MKVSIIGGAGFIGQSLSEYFSNKNLDVRLIDTKLRFSKLTKWQPKIMLIEGIKIMWEYLNKI